MSVVVRWSGLLLAPLLAALLVGCEVNVKDPGEVPQVEVDRGRAPVVETRPADVDIRTEEREVTVPSRVDVDINTERRSVRVPDVNVDVRTEPQRVPDVDVDVRSERQD